MSAEENPTKPKPPVYLPESDWLEIFSRHNSSGKSIKSICEEEGVSKSAFSENRKKLLKKGVNFLELPLSPEKGELLFELRSRVLNFEFLIELKKD